MGQSKYEELKQFIKEQEPNFLERAGLVNRKQSYVCPCCCNGSGHNHTGIIRFDKKDSWKCFACGKNMDVFDLIMHSQGISDFKEAFKWACKYYGYEYDFTGKHKNHISRQYPPYENEVCHTEYFAKVAENDNFDYLLSRGISIKTQKRFHIGFDANWRHPKVSDTIPTTPRCIIPTSPYSYLARDVRESAEMTEVEKKYCKSKVGTVHIFNIDVLKCWQEYIFICEGEIDAISVEECEYPAIGLGSAANVDRLLDEWQVQDVRKRIVYIFPDNDEKGKEVAEKLKCELPRRGLCEEVHIVRYPPNYHFKDPNDFLVKDRAWFENFLSLTLKETYLTNTLHVDNRTFSRLKEISKSKGYAVEDMIRALINHEYLQNGKDEIDHEK